jgi:hypothetical protein
MVRTAGSISGGAGHLDRSVVCGGLACVAESRFPRNGVWGGAGASASGYAVEGKQGGVRPDRHCARDVQPVDLSAAGKPCVLVAGAALVAVAVER